MFKLSKQSIINPDLYIHSYALMYWILTAMHSYVTLFHRILVTPISDQKECKDLSAALVNGFLHKSFTNHGLRRIEPARLPVIFYALNTPCAIRRFTNDLHWNE